MSRIEPLNRRKKSNIQHSTSNIQCSVFVHLLDVGRSMFDVGCSQRFMERCPSLFSFTLSEFQRFSFSSSARLQPCRRFRFGNRLDAKIHERQHRKPSVQRFHALAFRVVARAAHFRRVSAGVARPANFRRSRLRFLFLPGSPSFSSNASGTANCHFGIPAITAACRSSRNGTPCRSTRRR